MRRGTLAAYDNGRGAGLIQPDAGGAVIVFGTADQPRLYPEPKLFQRYSYSVLEASDGGQPRAFNLTKISSLNGQVEPSLCDPMQLPVDSQESFMDLNELLRAHQLEVMKLSVAGSDEADERHFGLIAQYADQIRALRKVQPGASVAHNPSAPPTIIYGSYAGSAVTQDAGAETSAAI